ncbi:MAG: AAA family ATPase, partial [Tannerellaceae bacterium]|nr:AAA family ATPase [Tannerellaceae bacterium]
MLTIRKLPVGIQDFEKLRKEEYIYVDKTEYVYRLTRVSSPYFLGRPRRFGKSLFLSTLKAYFLGKKELFEGLAIAGPEKDWIKYPVFHIDFNVEGYTDLTSLYVALDTNLRNLEQQWGKNEADITPASRLLGLINRAYKQTGRKVVVLIDEYDKPLVNTLDNENLNKSIRDTLKGFYGVLKSADAHLRFVFLTGVTKFSKVSVFSDLNHLTDISLDNEFA